MRKFKINRRKKCFDFIKYYLIFVCFTNTSNLLLQAQNKEITPLNIGDNIPDQIWDMPINVMNNPDGKNIITLREYKGKLILLDFWGTYCSSCIGGFPHLMDIQDKNKDKIAILAVSNEGKEKLQKFFATGLGKDRKIPTTFEERTLAKYFPHRTVPHTVWILPEGKYFNPSSSREITQSNIDAILRNEKSNFIVKLDTDPKKPLLLSDNFYANSNLNLGFYSLFFNGFYPGYPTGGNFKRDETGKLYGRQYTNKKLISIIKSVGMELFKEKGETFSDRRIILKSKNPLVLDSNENFAGPLPNDQYFSYELIIPTENSGSLYSYMLSDLNKYLDVTLNLQKISTDCLILIRTSDKDKLKTKSKISENKLLEDNNRYVISNEPFGLLLNILFLKLDSKLPIIDETGYKYNVDIDLKGIDNLDHLRDALKKYDLDIIKQERKLLMYIIEDK